MQVIDEGVGIADIHQAMDPLYTSRPKQERSGMGFMFMEAFMDEFEANGTTLGVVMGRRNIGGGTFGQGNVTPEDLYELMNAYPMFAW